MHLRSLFVACVLAGTIVAFSCANLCGVTSSFAGAVPTSTAQPTATPTAEPTPTVTPPPPATILSAANGAVEARHSVLERGTFISSNEQVAPTFSYTAAVSWALHRFRDIHWFSQPAFMTPALGYGTRVIRVTNGKTLAEKIDGIWTCRVDNERAAVLWQPPSFAFPAPRVVGTTTVQDHSAWDVRGTWVHHRRGSITRLRIDVLVDRDRGLLLESKATGTVTDAQGTKATIAAEVTYYDYGHMVSARAPKECLRTRRLG